MGEATALNRNLKALVSAIIERGDNTERAMQPLKRRLAEELAAREAQRKVEEEFLHRMTVVLDTNQTVAAEIMGEAFKRERNFHLTEDRDRMDGWANMAKSIMNGIEAYAKVPIQHNRDAIDGRIDMLDVVDKCIQENHDKKRAIFEKLAARKDLHDALTAGLITDLEAGVKRIGELLGKKPELGATLLQYNIKLGQLRDVVEGKAPLHIDTAKAAIETLHKGRAVMGSRIAVHPVR